MFFVITVIIKLHITPSFKLSFLKTIFIFQTPTSKATNPLLVEVKLKKKKITGAYFDAELGNCCQGMNATQNKY